MYRKGVQAAESEFKRYGADRWVWDSGRGKHQIVTVEFGPARVKLGFAHSGTDDRTIKRIVAQRFRQEGIKLP